MTSRVPHIHESDSCTFTPYAAQMCQALNQYKKANPDCTFEQMARWFNGMHRRHLSTQSIARYYYGVHHRNSYTSGNYTRARLNAQVTI